MNPVKTAAEHARGVLEATADTRDATASADVLSLRSALAQLVEAIDTAPRSVRQRVQADEEFHHLVRAARLEIRAARNAMHRLNSFEKSLTGLLWEETEDGR